MNARNRRLRVCAALAIMAGVLNACGGVRENIGQTLSSVDVNRPKVECVNGDKKDPNGKRGRLTVTVVNGGKSFDYDVVVAIGEETLASTDGRRKSVPGLDDKPANVTTLKSGESATWSRTMPEGVKQFHLLVTSIGAYRGDLLQPEFYNDFVDVECPPAPKASPKPDKPLSARDDTRDVPGGSFSGSFVGICGSASGFQLSVKNTGSKKATFRVRVNQTPAIRGTPKELKPGEVVSLTIPSDARWVALVDSTHNGSSVDFSPHCPRR